MTDARAWTHAALYGALWGALELSLGTVLHLSRLPLRGTVMALLGLMCLVTLRRLSRKPGVCLVAGMVAVFLKIFTLGGLYPGPLIGIFLEAVVVEAVFLILGTRLFAAVAGGAIVLALTPIQMTVMIRVVAGADALSAAVEAARAAAQGLGVAGVSGSVLLAGMMVGTGLVGAAGGFFSWRLAGGVEQRLGRFS